MIHLDEFVLNEYADGVLAAVEVQAVENHLESCPECRARLTELQGLFAVLDAVSDIPLMSDLSPSVLAEIEPIAVWWHRWVIVLQMVTAVIFSILLWPAVETWLATSGTFTQEITNWWIQIALSWEELVAWGTAVFQQVDTINPSFNLPTEQWFWLIGSALLIWLLGNGLLLNPKQRQTTS